MRSMDDSAALTAADGTDPEDVVSVLGSDEPATSNDPVESGSADADGTTTDTAESDAEAEEHGDTTSPESDDAASRGGKRVLAGAIVAVVIAAAAVVASALLWVHDRDGRVADARAADAVATAKSVVSDLTTLNKSTAKTSVDRVLAQTTGDFRQQFSASSSAFQAALDQGQVDSVGRVDAAGLVSADASSAQVLVASSSTVKNSAAPQGEPRFYRMKVSLARNGESWLVSNVEFVS